MQNLIKSKESVSFKNILNEFIKKLNEVKDGINEDIKKYNLEKYNEIIEGSDEDILTQYETWYDQLSEVVINNDKTIQQLKKLSNQFEEFNKFIEREIINNDEVKVTLNQLVDKIIDKETIIYDKKEEYYENENKETLKKINIEGKTLQIALINVKTLFKEKDRFKKESDERKREYEEKLNELESMKLNYDILEINPFTSISKGENVNLFVSYYFMKKWCGKQKFSIIFDSKTDGNGKGVLANKVMNKRSLYFVTFDYENNVFGGYVNEFINKTGYITDPKSFVFSLIRNGQVKNKKYNIKPGKEEYAFYLNSNHDYLYIFGNIKNCQIKDIVVPKIGLINKGICQPIYYEYNGEQQPLRDESKGYTAKRLLVLEMIE